MEKKKKEKKNTALRYRSSVQLHLRGNVFGRLYSDGGVPLSGGQHRHLVQELVDARHQVVTVFGFVRDIVENLSGGRQGEGEITHRSTIARKRARERASKPIHTGCDDVNPGRSTFNLKVQCVIFRYFFKKKPISGGSILDGRVPSL